MITDELVETRIPLGLKYVLYADLVCMLYTAVTCYGRFQATWYRMTSTKVGLTIMWQGQLFRGFASVLLLPMLLRTLSLGMMTAESIGLLFFAEALWIGVYIGTAGPGTVCWLGLLINPHMWLALGFVAAAREHVAWWHWAGIAFATLQCIYTRYTYKTAVFGPDSQDFTFEKYRDAVWQAPSTRKSLGIGTLMVNSLSIRLRTLLFRAEAPHSTTRQLRVELSSAHNLRRREASCQPCSDLPDPFLKVRLGEKEHTTKWRTGELSPEWGPEDRNSFGVTVHPEEEVLGMDKLRLEVWDRGRALPHSSLGWLELPLSGLLPLLDGTTGCSFRAGLKDGGLGELSFKAALEDVTFDPSSPSSGKAVAGDFLRRYLIYIAMLVLVVQCVAMASLGHVQWRGSLPGLDECLEDTGASCYYLLGGCESYRNSSCVFGKLQFRGRCVCDTRVSCAYGGFCLPKPSARTYLEPGPVPELPRKALVLSGGGAKGAWELGVLEGICQNESRAEFRDWTMILGTSIGALNAGLLAQFSPELQCSQAVPALADYWGSIVASEDVWESPTTIHIGKNDHTKCLNPLEASALLWYFGPTGGLCDPRPGAERYEFEVSRERIKASGMELRVLATSLGDGGDRWWTQNDSSIVQGAEASGSIAPLVWPKEVGGQWYIDGGFIANTPLLRALQEGVRDILVIMLNPLASPSIPNVSKQRKAGDFGMEILAFEYDIFVYRYFVGFELSTACRNYTHARIRGYVPKGSVGSILDFDTEHIARMQSLGRNTSSEAPVDLCKHFGHPRHRAAHEPRPPPRAAAPPAPPGPAPLAAAASGGGGCQPRGLLDVVGGGGRVAPAAAASAAVVGGLVALAWTLRRRRGRRRGWAEALAPDLPSLSQPLARP